MQEFQIKQLRVSISYYDNAESFYHGYLIGVFNGIKGYLLVLNKESGDGRPDLVLRPVDLDDTAVIIEIKTEKILNRWIHNVTWLLSKLIKKQYVAEFKENGYEKIIKYEICFVEKHVG